MLISVAVYAQFLRSEFLPYLKAWEDSVKSRKGFTAKEKKMMMISQETLNGIRITGRLLHCTLYMYNKHYMHVMREEC